jgi:hypothetical protein
VFTMWDGAVNILSQFKEVNTQWKIYY